MPLTGPSGASHPGTDYYVNPLTHTIQRQGNPLLAAGLQSTGWLGPFSYAQAQAAAAGLPQNPLNPGVAGAGPAVGQGIANKAVSQLGGLAAIGDFFNRLTQSNTWLRVGEVAGGGLLAYLGIKSVMSGSAASNAIKSAGKTAKKAALIAAK
jgi:hypothetical protein